MAYTESLLDLYSFFQHTGDAPIKSITWQFDNGLMVHVVVLKNQTWKGNPW